MVRDFIGSHSEFLPRGLNLEFPSLEACICFWVGDTTFLIKYLESWLKDDSGNILNTGPIHLKNAYFIENSFQTREL